MPGKKQNRLTPEQKKLIEEYLKEIGDGTNATTKSNAIAEAARAIAAEQKITNPKKLATLQEVRVIFCQEL